jgi:predicted transcriptional regulator of viral defense system
MPYKLLYILGKFSIFQNSDKCADSPNFIGVLAFCPQFDKLQGHMSYIRQIEQKILTMPRGNVFTLSDLADLAEPDTVKKSLQRLEQAGLIRRLMRGVYDYPAYSNFLKEYVAPDPAKIAEAIARSNGWTIAVNGDTALNLLGLSTQIVSSYLYMSNGPNVSVKTNHLQTNR